MIAKHLIDDLDFKIQGYFPGEEKVNWKEKYFFSLNQIYHDEPWLTLIASYAIFGNQKYNNQNHLSAINQVLNSSGISNPINFSSIDKIVVEEKLPEIISYRNFLKELFKNQNFHLYPDRFRLIDEKKEMNSSSFEGNTNLDLIIEGISNGRKTTCFIEAKFLSDISYQIKYNPVRDQIIRNIDCGIDYVQKKKHSENFEDFYFFLLTPKVFRPQSFGERKVSSLHDFGADSSRLYCYKMLEYKNFEFLKRNLPHRNELSDEEWKKISENIGWITFEDFYTSSKKFSTYLNLEEEQMIHEFFMERNLV